MSYLATSGAEPRACATAPRYFRRFDSFHRFVHGFLMASFLGLAATGLPIRFNETVWAVKLTQALGGLGSIIFCHKTFAAILTGCLLLHLGRVGYTAFGRGERGVFWGANSLVPQPKDGRDMLQHFRWFFGMGPRPRFDRFTYWEKFDYWVVVSGLAIIGTSGYLMWASSFFGSFLPGWIFNMALLLHSEEALLVVCFIFVIHFFNSHLRPEKFPMDLAMFTGRISENELRDEHPLEMERLIAQQKLDDLEIDPPPPWLMIFGRIIGYATVTIGFTLLVLTLLAL